MGLFSKEPVCVETKGGVLKCLVCGQDEFYKRKAQLNTSGSELLGMAWADRTALCYVCHNCGYIHWFLDPPG